MTGLKAYSVYAIAIKGQDNSGGDSNIEESHLASAETLDDRPQVQADNGVAVPGKQAITFSWTSANPQLNEATCQAQNGKMDGFFVQLYGLDPWSPEGLVKEQNLSDSTPYYYVSNLRPYSSYKLTVFVRNSNGLIDPSLPLIIPAQTQPHIPRVSL